MTTAAKTSKNPALECRQCGTCCKKGGPCFHEQDRHLIEKGIILSKYLYTIRKGEIAHDNVRDCLSPVLTDIIKIKEKENTGECIFYADDIGCTIYKNRPLECRALQCWDTQEINKIYSENRLTRKDLLENINGLWDLICEHQARCDFKKINKLIEDVKDKNKESGKQFSEILNYDKAMRELLVEKGGVKPGMTDFLFGRPLVKILKAFGINVRNNKILLI